MEPPVPSEPQRAASVLDSHCREFTLWHFLQLTVHFDIWFTAYKHHTHKNFFIEIFLFFKIFSMNWDLKNDLKCTSNYRSLHWCEQCKSFMFCLTGRTGQNKIKKLMILLQNAPFVSLWIYNQLLLVLFSRAPRALAVQNNVKCHGSPDAHTPLWCWAWKGHACVARGTSSTMPQVIVGPAVTTDNVFYSQSC